MGLLNATGKSSSSKGNPQIGVTVSLALLGLCMGGLAALGVRGLVPINSLPPASEPPDIYISLQMRSVESAKSASFILSGFRGGSPEQTIDIDEMHGDGLANIYSGSLDRMALNELSGKIRHKPKTSSGMALVASLQRAGKLIADKPDKPLELYIVTEGSEDPLVLAELKNVAEEIRESLKDRGNVRLYLMGLDPEKRIETIATLNPIRTIYGGSCAQSSAECRELIDNAVR